MDGGEVVRTGGNDETRDLLGMEAYLETWLRLVVSALGLGRPAAAWPTTPHAPSRPGSQIEMRGPRGKWDGIPPSKSTDAGASFAQLAVPAPFADEIRARFTARGYQVRLGDSLTSAARTLTIWQHGGPGEAA